MGGPSNKYLLGMTIRRTDAQVITVESMTVSWSTADREMRRIYIDGSESWTGRADSGDNVNIVDYSPDTAWENIDSLRYTNDMSGGYFTITFVMADSSTKVVNYQD